jgi:hypothetical protein
MVKNQSEMMDQITPFTLQVNNLNPTWRIQDGGRICKFGVNLVITIQVKTCQIGGGNA